MKKILILMGLIFLLFLNTVSSSPSQEEIENFYGIHKTDVLKTNSASLEIRLLRDGISYKEEFTILFPNNNEGYLVFTFPSGISINNMKDIKLINIKTNQPLQKYENITSLDNCSNLYMIKEINDTLTILACPVITNQEYEIGIDMSLTSQKIPTSCIDYDYYMEFPEILIGVKDYLSENFQLHLSIDAEDSILVSLPPKTNCEKIGMIETSIPNGIECQGTPIINKQFLVLNNISLWGKDKEKTEENRNTLRFWMTLLFPLVIGLILGFLFKEKIKNIFIKIKNEIIIIKNEK